MISIDDNRLYQKWLDMSYINSTLLLTVENHANSCDTIVQQMWRKILTHICQILLIKFGLIKLRNSFYRWRFVVIIVYTRACLLLYMKSSNNGQDIITSQVWTVISQQDETKPIPYVNQCWRPIRQSGYFTVRNKTSHKPVVCFRRDKGAVLIHGTLSRAPETQCRVIVSLCCCL